jgi:hypothetical protein
MSLFSYPRLGICTQKWRNWTAFATARVANVIFWLHVIEGMFFALVTIDISRFFALQPTPISALSPT